MSATSQWRLCCLDQIVYSVLYFLERHPSCTMYLSARYYELATEFDASRADDLVGVFDTRTDRKAIERAVLEAMLAEVS